MSAEEPRESEVDPALREALDLCPPPGASGAFREQLRQTFLAAPFEAADASEIEDQDLGPAPVVAPRWDETVLARARPEVGAQRKPLWLKLATVAALAAAVWLIFHLPTHNGWRVADSSNFELARVDGVEFTAKQSARLAAALAQGTLLEVEGGAIDLVLDRRMAIRLAPGSAVRLTRVPEPQVLEDILLEQQQGSLAVVTGPEFHGSTLRVRTPDTEVRVVGTELAVDVLPGEGTCVCCGEGSVELSESAGAAAGPVSSVSRGEMTLVSSQHQPSQRGAAVEAHLVPLEALRRIWGGVR